MKIKLCEYVNIERSNRSIKIVNLNDDLSFQAQRHTDDMQINNFVSHIGSDGSDYVKRIKRSNFACNPVGEIILKGPGGPNCLKVAVNHWLSSPPHREILLDYSATTIGIGISMRNEKYKGNYFCILFVKQL